MLRQLALSISVNSVSALCVLCANSSSRRQRRRTEQAATARVVLRWQCLKTRHPLLAILREYLAILLQELRLHGMARRVRGIRRRTEVGAPRSGVERGAFRPRPDMVALDTTPAIVDAHGERRLQFSDDALQSKMRLDDPQALIAPYTRQMLSCLLFDPDPAHVLLIGLGGGSQASTLR